MKAPRSLGGALCLFFALLTSYTSLNELKTLRRLPISPEERQGQLLAMITVPAVLFIASFLLFRRASRKREATDPTDSRSNP